MRDEKVKTEILTKTQWWFIIVAVIFALAAPWIFTRTWLFFGVSFEETGQIGDTIGGITAPFINLIAAYLVFRSFSAQIQANRIQQRNHRAQMAKQEELHNEQINLLSINESRNFILSLYDKIEEDFNNQEVGKSPTGWGGSLLNNLITIDKRVQKDSWNIADRNYINEKSKLAVKCARNVNFSLQNFLLFLSSVKSILLQNSDFTLQNTAQYCLTKVRGLFSQTNYDAMLQFDHERWKGVSVIDNYTFVELQITPETSKGVEILIKDIEDLLK